MAQNEISRGFAMSFTELISIGKNLVVVLTRDLSDLSIFGLTSTNITNLSGLINSFELMRTDIEYEGDVMVKTQEKDAIAEQIKEQIRFMNVRVEACYGADNVVYDLFRFTDMNTLSDNDLLTTFQRITRTANQYIVDLGSYGVTAALITQLETLATDFSDAIVAQEETIDARRLAANQRTISANEIYSFIANYSNYGKKFYAKTNPAKYNDYVIYGSSSPSSLTAVANFAYSWTETDFTWDAVTNATSYQIEESADQVNWTQIYAGEYNNYSFTPTVSGTLYYRCRARNSGGYGDYSATISIEFLNNLPAPQNLQILAAGPSGLDLQLSWDAVPTATSYWPYRSVVALGAPAGSFSYQTVNVPTTSWVQTVEAGHRYYYKIKGVNPIKQGEFSEIVFIDVV